MVAYRMTPRSLGYAIAVVVAFFIVSGAVRGIAASHGAIDVLFVAIAAFGIAAAATLVHATRTIEVRAYDAGIMSMGLRSLQMIRWHDIDRFEVDGYRSSRFSVYAVLTDGSRVALDPLRGGQPQRARVEQLTDELEARLEQARRRGAGVEPWPPVPFGWRRLRTG